MPNRDNYRGYGSPSGRYYENREYERGSNDRNRDDRGRMGGRDEDRGFFERAGEEVRSWFSDDDDRGRDRDRHNDRDDMRDQPRDRDRGYGWSSMMSGRGGRDHDPNDRPPQTFGGEPTSGGYDYRRDEWRGGDRSRGGGSDNARRSGGSHPHDEHYSEWRQQQLSELDRDYDEYRRENRDKFHSEFSNWRGQRQQQRSSMRQVTEHMEVIGSDGEAVGTVDKVSGDKIVLTKSGAMAGGHHHSIPCSWIQSVEDKVTINKTSEQARKQWTDEDNRRALFETDDQRNEDGPHMLNRSFSGTYER